MKRISLFTFFIFLGIAGCMAQVSGEKIEKVYVAFKTHLDVGFTDLSSVVTERYVHDFIPKAIEVSERLRADGSGDRYVWTTGSWLIWKYLRTASPEAVKQLEEAIGRGDIVWNSVPYTVESETMTRELFETCLLLSKRLDKKYNKQTIAAKMTDVPGHTRSIIDPMYDAGIRLLHVGINSACPLPSVPTFCRWRSPSGNDLLLVYQKDYGEDEVLPDGKTVVSINFTGDNHGPHSYERVKKIYADLRKRYPQAQLVGASFNDVARELLLIKKDLPVVTSEIGDTWIFGYGGAPIRMAKFRAVSRLYSQWLNEGKIKKDSDVALDFAAELGLIAEHTQGVDVKTHLRQWDKYDMDKFLKGRSEGVFSMAEASWKEIDNYIDSAIAFLPASLQKEAREVVAEVDKVKLEDNSKMKPMARKRWEQPIAGGMTLAGLGRDAGGLGQLRVGAQVRGLAVHRHERLRLHDGQHELQLLGPGMARHVHARAVLVVHVGADLGQRVDDARDGLLVAGNRRGRDDDGVALLRSRWSCARRWRCGPAPKAARPGCPCT